jgi:transcriptional regulator with XRE-family HTH domain
MPGQAHAQEVYAGTGTVPETTIGERLRSWRDQKAGISLDKLVSAIELLPETERPKEYSKSQIARWERDEVSPPADYLLYLVRYGAVDPAWLLVGGEVPEVQLRLELIRKLASPASEIRVEDVDAIVREAERLRGLVEAGERQSGVGGGGR